MEVEGAVEVGLKLRGWRCKGYRELSGGFEILEVGCWVWLIGSTSEFFVCYGFNCRILEGLDGSTLVVSIAFSF